MKPTKQFTLTALFAGSLALLAFAQTSHFDELANLPFSENRPTKETTQTLRDELLFERATQTYLWAMPLMRTVSGKSFFTILRLDLLPTDAQPALRENFRRYVEAWLEVYRKLPDIAAAKEELAKATTLQGEIWRQAVAATRAPGAPAAAPMLLLPALNAMIDITTTRTMAAQMHPPPVIFAMLFGLALVAALLAGYGLAGRKARSQLHMLSFAVALVVAVYVILDIEFPHLGLIRIDVFDQVLVELRESMQ